MTQTKLIFVGPVGAGKTTSIRTLVNSEMVCTDERATDMTRQWKETTTVALDYGTLLLEAGHKVHLYGLPGQERFKFMWDILTLGVDGVVLLLDNARPAPLKDLDFYLDEFSSYARTGAMVVAVTKMDVSDDGLTLDDYRQALARHDLDLSISRFDARQESHVLELIDQALASVQRAGGDKAPLCPA